MANEAMELHKMSSQAEQEARHIEAENSTLEMELKKLEKEIKGMRSALNSNFLLPRRSPTVTRISPNLGAFSRRSFDFLKDFGGARNSPDLATGREIIDRRSISRSSNDKMPVYSNYVAAFTV